MLVVFLGPPGAGKGTQASRLSAKYGLVKISTGDMLRAAVTAGSELGERVRSIMETGELVDDATMAEVVRVRLAQDDARSGAILDGYPRTLAQAETLEEILDGVDVVLFLNVPEPELIDRISKRRACPDCGANYHLTHRAPATEGICDRCGGRLIHRDDDREEVVRERLAVYRAQTEPLVDYYRTRGLLAEIDGTGSIDSVWERIDGAMSEAVRT